MDNFGNPESEIVFWSRQLSEHALFMHLGFVDKDLRDEAHDLHKRWEAFRADGRESVEGFNVLAQDLKEYKMRVLDRMLALTTNTDENPAWIGWLPATFVQHITRELNYSVAKVNGRTVTPEEEVNFWTLINSEHAIFAAQLLDPSERDLIQMAYDLAAQIEGGNTCESCLFVQISLDGARELDAYNKKAKDLMNDNSLISNIHPVLLTHVIREGLRSIEALQNAAFAIGDKVPLADESFGFRR